MQRHPVAQTVTHVDFIIVRRDEVIAADVPVMLVGEALEVHHGDGLVDQQMFTLSINALPAAIPTSIEVDVSALTIGGAASGSPTSRCPSGVTTDVDPETAVAIGQPPRVVTAEEAARAPRARVPRVPPPRRRRRGGLRGLLRRGLGPAQTFLPVGAPGHPGRPAGRRAGQSGRRIRRQPAQRGVRRGASCWPSATGVACGPRRAWRPGSRWRRWRGAGSPWPSRPPT